MDEETLWVLKMLSARKISARSADRILRALELLRQSEERKVVSSSAVPPVPEEKRTSAGMPQEAQHIIPTEDELSPAEDAGTAIQEEVERATEETQEAKAEIEEEFADASVVAKTEEKQEVTVIQEAGTSEEEIVWARGAVPILESSEEEKEATTREITSDVTDEEQAEGEEEGEEREGIIISSDVEQSVEALEAAQKPQEAMEEVVEEVEETSREAAVAEKESPPTLDAEVEREIEGSDTGFDTASPTQPEPQEAVPEVAPTVEEEITAEVAPEEDQHTEEGEHEVRPYESEGTVWTEIIDKRPLLGDDGVGIIEDIPHGVELILEKSAGNVTIQGWDQPRVRAEGKGNSSTVLQAEKSLKIGSEDDIVLYIPPAIGKISITSGSGSIGIEKYPNGIVIDNDTGDISIGEANGDIRVSSIEGRITLKDCRGKVSLESKSGDIIVRKAAAVHIENVDGTIDLGETSDGVLTITEVNIETTSGDVVLADIGGDIDVKSSGGNVTIERCRSQSINVGSSGGDLTLRDVVNNMNLKGENGNITVEDFSGEVRVNAKDTEVFLRNSGDAEIHIESDGGNISIEDCYADAYVDSGTGNVHVFGGNLSFGGMGRVELKMRDGDAYLRRRTFEDVRIAIESGSAELNMEKLSSGGSGRVSVYRGDVTVRVSPEFQCEAIIHAPRKKVYLELPVEVTEKDKNLLRGTLNGGGSKIELVAPNGEIRLQALELPACRLQNTQSDMVNTASSS